MNKGDYVFATKYSDGDPCDGWAIGFYDGTLEKYGKPERHMVVADNGSQFRGNGFRRCEKITSSEANAIIEFDRSIVNDRGAYPEEPIYNLWDILEKFRNEKPQSKD